MMKVQVRKMIKHNLIQGSPAWLAHRTNFRNASDAPAMMGVSKYKSRTDLLQETKTGIVPEVSKHTQAIFDDGHRYEALARPYAEKIIGEELSPEIGTDGVYGASFDGITFMGDILFEHKTLNDSLRAVSSPNELDEQYLIQMEQQLMVSGAEKCLFVASLFGKDDALIEQVNFWYEPNLMRRQAIVDGWAQFEKDLADFVPVVAEVKLVAAEVESFPIVSIQVKGELIASNFDVIKPKFDKFLTETNTKPTTDQEFVDGDANAKFSRDTAKTCRLIAKQTVDQISSISEAVRFLETYADKFDALGLLLEKSVKAEKENRRLAVVSKAQSDYSLHIEAIRLDIAPIVGIFPAPPFADATKNKRTITSMDEAVGQVLTDAKIYADGVAREIRAKLTWYTALAFAKGYEFLFHDLQQAIYKAEDDFKLLVTNRIEQHDKAITAREAEVAAKVAEDKAKVQEPVKVADAVVTIQAIVKPIDTAAALVEHQDEISDFLKEREFGKEENKVRAILAEFVKFQATYTG